MKFYLKLIQAFGKMRFLALMSARNYTFLSDFIISDYYKLYNLFYNSSDQMKVEI